MSAKRRVTSEEFVRIWQTSKDLDEVVERTGMNRTAIHQRAYDYRSKGKVVLKNMPQPRKRRLDYSRLRAIASGKA